MGRPDDPSFAAVRTRVGLLSLASGFTRYRFAVRFRPPDDTSKTAYASASTEAVRPALISRCCAHALAW